MDSNHLTSKAELDRLLTQNSRQFVLLYKGSSEVSQCAWNRFTNALPKLSGDARVFFADVEKVRDIHTAYGVESAPSLLVFDQGELSNVIKGCMDQDYYESILEGRTISHKVSGSEGRKTKRVIVYTTPTCSWCTKIKEHLKAHQIPYREVDVASHPDMAEEMRRKSGQMGVPQTEIDGQMIVGFDRPKIDRLLEIV